MEIIRGNVVDLIDSFNQEPDLIVTDPPYALTGAGAEHGITASVAVGLRESAKKLKRGSWAIVFSASSWRSTAYMIEALRGVLEPVRISSWVKPKVRTRVSTVGWQWATVNVIAFRKGPKNRVDLPPPMASLDWIEAEPVMNGRRAELPPSVCQWAVAPFAIPGGLVLDPFCGSGALLTAAERIGMSGVGFEMQGK